MNGEKLSRRERQIMEVIFRRGEATAAQVTESLADGPTNTAVRTFLRILEDKGHLRHRKEGREFVYRPTRTRGAAARSALRGLLATFFDDSVEQALASYMSDPKSRLSQEELDRLAAMIEQARKRS